MGKVFKINKNSKINTSSSFFGMLLLVAGLGTGVVLVGNQQLFNQKAQSVDYTCGKCDVSEIINKYGCSGGKACRYSEEIITCSVSTCSKSINVFSDCHYKPSCLVNGNICKTDADCFRITKDTSFKCKPTLIQGDSKYHYSCVQ